MTEQHDHEGFPPDFGPGGIFITNGDEFKVGIAGLSEEQSARVFALQQARLVLTADAQTDMVQLGNAHREWVKPSHAPEVMDVYNLALFILDGIDPWQEVRTQPAPLFRVRTDPDGAGHAEAEGGDEGLMPGFD